MDSTSIDGLLPDAWNDALDGLRDARTTLSKRTYGTIGSDNLTLPSDAFHSVLRNIDKVAAALATRTPAPSLGEDVVERLAKDVVLRWPAPAYPYNLYGPVTDAIRTGLSAARESGR